VVISPESRELIVEATGNAPEPTVTVSGGLVTRRFRADYSSAAPTEPNSVPASEFLRVFASAGACPWSDAFRLSATPWLP